MRTKLIRSLHWSVFITFRQRPCPCPTHFPHATTSQLLASEKQEHDQALSTYDRAFAESTESHMEEVKAMAAAHQEGLDKAHQKAQEEHDQHIEQVCESFAYVTLGLYLVRNGQTAQVLPLALTKHTSWTSSMQSTSPWSKE